MPSEVRFAPLKRRLEEHGWTLNRITGSHHIFKREGSQSFTIPVHRGKVKSYYAKKVERAIRQLQEGEED